MCNVVGEVSITSEPHLKIIEINLYLVDEEEGITTITLVGLLKCMVGNFLQNAVQTTE